MSSYEIERNDPCPCGSGRKFKKCGVQKCGSPTMRKFKAVRLEGASFAAMPQVQGSTGGLTQQDLAQRVRAHLQA